MPNHTRYAADSFDDDKRRSSERCTRLPKPNATQTATRYTPNALPTTHGDGGTAPGASARPITSSTLGPGIAMSTRCCHCERERLAPDTMLAL